MVYCHELILLMPAFVIRDLAFYQRYQSSPRQCVNGWLEKEQQRSQLMDLYHNPSEKQGTPNIVHAPAIVIQHRDEKYHLQQA